MVERGPFLEQDGGRIAYVSTASTRGATPDPHRRQQPRRRRDPRGLKPGDRIVVSGTDHFGDAERVRITGE